MEDDLYGRRPQWKTTSVEDDLHGRQPQWKMTSVEDDLSGRQPQWKMISVEDNLIGRWPQWKKTSLEDHLSGKGPQWKMTYLAWNQQNMCRSTLVVVRNNFEKIHFSKHSLNSINLLPVVMCVYQKWQERGGGKPKHLHDTHMNGPIFIFFAENDCNTTHTLIYYILYIFCRTLYKV